MKIGDEEITREDMPAQIAWQNGNPDHLRQGFQDVLNAKLNQGLMMPQQPQEAGMMDTAQTQGTWK